MSNGRSDVPSENPCLGGELKLSHFKLLRNRNNPGKTISPSLALKPVWYPRLGVGYKVALTIKFVIVFDFCKLIERMNHGVNVKVLIGIVYK